MQDLITEARSIMLDWSNVKNADGTYDVTFDDGREFKGVHWRKVAGHNVLVTKKGKMAGVPDEVSKDVAGSPDADLDGSKTKKDKAKKGEKAPPPEKASAATKEKETLKHVRGLSNDDALSHLEGLYDDEDGLPVTDDSRQGRGLFGFVGKLVGKFASGVMKLVKGGAKAAAGVVKNATEKLSRANTLYKGYRKKLRSEATKRAKAKKSAQKSVAVLKKAYAAQRRAKRWTSAGKMKDELKKLEGPKKSKSARKAGKAVSKAKKKAEKLQKRMSAADPKHPLSL